MHSERSNWVSDRPMRLSYHHQFCTLYIPICFLAFFHSRHARCFHLPLGLSLAGIALDINTYGLVLHFGNERLKINAKRRGATSFATNFFTIHSCHFFHFLWKYSIYFFIKDEKNSTKTDIWNPNIDQVYFVHK